MNKPNRKDNPAHKRLREHGFREIRFASTNEKHADDDIFIYWYMRRPKVHGESTLNAVLFIFADDKAGWKLFVEAGPTTVKIDKTLDDLDWFVRENTHLKEPT